MQIGMVGLGRMGANMVRRLLRGGHQCVAYDRAPAAVQAMVADGASGVGSTAELAATLAAPRAIWLMVPAAIVDRVIDDLLPHLAPGDVIIDGGNSFYRDDVDRAKRLAAKGLHYVDCGTSGGVWGLERGYCLMIGGEAEVVRRLEPIFKTLAPERGYLHCGPSGAGHFVKMVHNGIEYGLMAAYAEGFNILKHANVGKRGHESDAETTPLRQPEYFQYDFNLDEIAEVWRHGSVISSWLLDLTASALAKSPTLANFSGHVSDSGEGRWTVATAIEAGVPADVLSAALFARFSSRDAADFQNRLLSAMRFEFGGHVEKKP
jgi:6-phosphogluconate dehydrogenase